MSPRILSLLNEADTMPDSRAKLELLQEAERLAEKEESNFVVSRIRLDICKEAVFNGHPQVSLVTFTKNLALFDQNQEELEDLAWNIYWTYKWIIPSLSFFPTISREQIESALADFGERLKRAGWTARSGAMLRLKCALSLRRYEEAPEHFDAWQSSRRDAMSDCVACEYDTAVDFHVRRKQWDKAFEAAAPILRRNLSCAEVPHRTYPSLTVAALEAGRMREAVQFATAGARLFRLETDLMSNWAELIEGLVRVHDLPKAVRVFERLVPSAFETYDQLGKMEVCLAGIFLSNALLAESPGYRFRLARRLDKLGLEGRREAGEVRAWLLPHATELAGKFDARNGNSYFTKLLGTRM